MKKLMTKHFSKWANKQNITIQQLDSALDEVIAGQYEADLGAGVIKKRIRFTGQGKSKSGRVIICLKKASRVIYLHGFAKNEKSNLSHRELTALKATAKGLLSLSENDLDLAIKNGVFIEVLS